MKKYKIETKKEYYLYDPKITSIVFDKFNRNAPFFIDIDPIIIINHYLGREIYITGNYKKCFRDKFCDSRLFYFRLSMYYRRVNTCDTFILHNRYYLSEDLEYHFTIANMLDLLLIYSIDEMFYDMVNYICALYCPLSPDLTREVHYNYKNENQRRIYNV